MGRVMALRGACFPRTSGREEDAQDADQTVSTLENPIEKESDK